MKFLTHMHLRAEFVAATCSNYKGGLLETSELYTLDASHDRCL